MITDYIYGVLRFLKITFRNSNFYGIESFKSTFCTISAGRNLSGSAPSHVVTGSLNFKFSHCSVSGPASWRRARSRS